MKNLKEDALVRVKNSLVIDKIAKEYNDINHFDNGKIN